MPRHPRHGAQRMTARVSRAGHVLLARETARTCVPGWKHSRQMQHICVVSAAASNLWSCSPARAQATSARMLVGLPLSAALAADERAVAVTTSDAAALPLRSVRRRRSGGVRFGSTDPGLLTSLADAQGAVGAEDGRRAARGIRQLGAALSRWLRESVRGWMVASRPAEQRNHHQRSTWLALATSTEQEPQVGKAGEFHIAHATHSGRHGS